MRRRCWTASTRAGGEGAARGPRDDPQLAAGEAGAVGADEAAAEDRAGAEGNGQRGAAAVAPARAGRRGGSCPVGAAGRLARRRSAAPCAAPSRCRRRGAWSRRCCRPVGGVGAEQVGAGAEVAGQRRDQLRRVRRGARLRVWSAARSTARRRGGGRRSSPPAGPEWASVTSARTWSGKPGAVVGRRRRRPAATSSRRSGTVDAPRPAPRCRLRRAARAGASRRPAPGTVRSLSAARSRPAANLTPVSKPAGPVIRQEAPPIGLAGPWSGFAQERSKSSTRRQPSPPASARLRGWAGGLLSIRTVCCGRAADVAGEVGGAVAEAVGAVAEAGGVDRRAAGDAESGRAASGSPATRRRSAPSRRGTR